MKCLRRVQQHGEKVSKSVEIQKKRKRFSHNSYDKLQTKNCWTLQKSMVPEGPEKPQLCN